ncbi:DUF1127 domain-containing protein [Pseudomonas quasicaspiana]|uniref:DUF1127 domain-containing protein n=1 Tax=Pseudomonas quasicaspiana TaxID=2829821 RepID=UPI001E3A9F1F|nr:DUF1127 domain-containing protein [Pseudomonas quasicaspiana]MCD5974666.1 DUF1127 domain-containing protein [Pseudomonas quasicaspiana]
MMKGQKGYVLVLKNQSRDSWIERLLRSIRRHASRWSELHRQRRQLASLSDAALKDLGLSRADVYQETGQHFWKDPMKR